MRGLAILNLLAPLRDGRRPRLPPNRISLECPTQPEGGKTVVLLMKSLYSTGHERTFGICCRTRASLWGTGQDLRRGNTICPPEYGRPAAGRASQSPVSGTPRR